MVTKCQASFLLQNMCDFTSQTLVQNLNQRGIVLFRENQYQDAELRFKLALMQDFQYNTFVMSTSTETFKADLLSLKLKNNRVRLEILNKGSYQIYNPTKKASISMFDEGFDRLKETIEIKRHFHEDKSAILYNLGKTQEKMGNFNLALDSYFDAIEGAEQVILVMILQSIGQIYYLHGNLEESLSAYSLALKITKQCLGYSSLTSALILNCIGVILYHLDCNGEGSALEATPLEESLRLMKLFLGNNHLNVATALNNLGRCYYRLQKYEDAIHAFKYAMEIRHAHFGRDHLDVAATFFNLGEAYQNIIDINIANDCYFEFLRIMRIKNMWYDPIVAKVLHLIAHIYREKDRNQMFATFQEALDVEAEVFGKESAQVAMTLKKLGALYFEEDNFQSAIAMYQKELLIENKICGTNSLESLSTLINIAEVFKKINEDQAYLDAYEKVLQIQKHLSQIS